VEELSPQALLNAARAAAVVVDRQGSRPRVASGLPMHMYSEDQLIAMLEWIQSDGVSRSDMDLKEQLRAGLAQKLRSARTEAALDSAVAAYRAWVAASKRSAADESADRAESDTAEAAAAEDGRAPAARKASRPAPEQTEPEVVPADQIIPSYDTDSLRHAELRDAGLRDLYATTDGGSTDDDPTAGAKADRADSDERADEAAVEAAVGAAVEGSEGDAGEISRTDAEEAAADGDSRTFGTAEHEADDAD